MKTLKVIAIATVMAIPLSAQAMCNGGYMHETTTASLCQTGQVWDETKEACVDAVG